MIIQFIHSWIEEQLKLIKANSYPSLDYLSAKIFLLLHISILQLILKVAKVSWTVRISTGCNRMKSTNENILLMAERLLRVK